MRALSDRIPTWYLLLAFVAGCVLAAFSVQRVEEKHLSVQEASKPAVTPAPAPAVCEMRTVRIRGYAGIEPLLASEHLCESPRFNGLKASITGLIQRFQADSTLMNASVYVRDLERGDWLVYNDAERYDPGSLLKVPVMMSYLHDEETDHRVMDARYSLSSVPAGLPSPFFPAHDQIQLGRPYSVAELMHHSIAGSDNLANLMLLQHMNTASFARIFSDLSLPPIDLYAQHYPMGVRDYSMFMKALFNSSYLSIPNSEFAMAQLADCDFNIGLRAGVPANVRMAHKFGESGDEFTKQLHESAVVYLNGSPYVLTVMTRGKDIHKLPEVLRGISEVVYKDLSKH